MSKLLTAKAVEVYCSTGATYEVRSQPQEAPGLTDYVVRGASTVFEAFMAASWVGNFNKAAAEITTWSVWGESDYFLTVRAGVPSDAPLVDIG